MRSGKIRGAEAGSRRNSVDESMENKKFQTEIRSFMMDIKESITDLQTNVKDVKTQMKEIKNSMEQLKQETRKNRKDIEVNKGEINRLHTLSNINNIEIQKQYEQIAILEQKNVDNWLRIKGLEEDEQQEETLYRKVIEMLAKLLGITTKKMNQDIEKIYRIRRPKDNTRRNKNPNDVIVQFTRQSRRDEVIAAFNKKGVTIQRSSLIFLKETTPKILKKRKEYEFITSILKRNQIRFRWERYEGLTLTYKGERIKIETRDKAKLFLEKYKEELDAKSNRNEYKAQQRKYTREEGKRQNREKAKVTPEEDQKGEYETENSEEEEEEEEEEELEEEVEGKQGGQQEDSELEGAVGGEVEQQRTEMEENNIFGLQRMDLDCIELIEDDHIDNILEC